MSTSLDLLLFELVIGSFPGSLRLEAIAMKFESLVFGDIKMCHTVSTVALVLVGAITKKIKTKQCLLRNSFLRRLASLSSRLLKCRDISWQEFFNPFRQSAAYQRYQGPGGIRFTHARTLLYDTLPTSKAAIPSSSLLTVIFVVTPLFAEKAIFTCAATFPPPRVFPYSFRVCVLVDIGTSVPSNGCRDRAFVSCSVASEFGT